MKTYAVGLIQNDNGEILLLRRSFSAPWMPNKWCLPGGSVENDETTEEDYYYIGFSEFMDEIKEEFKNISFNKITTKTGIKFSELVRRAIDNLIEKYAE